MLGTCGYFQPNSNFKNSLNVQFHAWHHVESGQHHFYSACALNVATAFMNYFTLRSHMALLPGIAYDLALIEMHMTLHSKFARDLPLTKEQVMST